jgi:fumarate reductase flavoprotein subunit
VLPIDDLSYDVLILGAGGAGMLAALHVTTANPRARIVIEVKGRIGQSGNTRMVQCHYEYFLAVSILPILR